MQVFDSISEINTNPMGYALVVLVLVFVLAPFLASKKMLAGRRSERIARGHTLGAEANATRRQSLGNRLMPRTRPSRHA